MRDLTVAIVHRYTIRPSGDVTLVASEPPTRWYARGDRLILAGMLLSFGTVALAFFVEVAERILYGENLPIPALAVLIPFFIGLGLCCSAIVEREPT
jgi:hypothetical protein